MESTFSEKKNQCAEKKKHLKAQSLFQASEQ